MSESGKDKGDRGVGDAVREAVERTLAATSGSAAYSRDRAGELVDELARRGREAGADLARRGQDAGAELGRRLEALERRLAEVEEGLRREEAGEEGTGGPAGGKPNQAKPKAEG